MLNGSMVNCVNVSFNWNSLVVGCKITKINLGKNVKKLDKKFIFKAKDDYI